MLLKGKNAVIYGGGGNIGAAVAREFADQGAKVHLAGRTLDTLKAVGDEFETAVVDATDPQAVEAHAQQIGRIDISFNLIGINDVQGTPMAAMDVEDFLSPIVTATRSHFLTFKAAANHGAGVILVFGGEGDPIRGYSIGGLQVAFHALEAMRRQFATENPKVRVVTLRTGGITESIPTGFAGRDELVKSLDDATLTGKAATLKDVARVAAFVASDHARTMTAATVNVSAGALLD
ncbi:SDR family NAD(P)-dependent oxidoreductase [Solirubrobacter soli]|uniref:SDR family NAD(P)-dependent oxidoreductase n=1 Tax=Solirubrobacter soli TaxID=363832 RepID=UPI0003F852AB|nr:SDR family oxidoreductase [Solirubrobacter soli]